MDDRLSPSGQKAARQTRWRRFVRSVPVLQILCVFALLLVGSLHQPPQPRADVASTFDVAEYVLPDGSVPDLCLSAAGDEGGSAAIKHSHGCEACRLTAILDFPAPAHDVYRQADYRITAPIIPVDTGGVGREPRYRAPPRAPPGFGIEA
ncbi:hypothetical protein [Azorhizobium sp. AG788]|uniref:hypothetical protein n=1 Tax=Azorhizobium sp. AG788 TaxID=2183897 RepID=UPI00313899D9